MKSPFKKITSHQELLKCIALRAIVFIQEQKVPYDLEFDDFDRIDNPKSEHFFAETITNENLKQPFACARVIWLTENKLKFERIAIAKEQRARGWGRKLLESLICHAQISGAEQVIIHAQSHLSNFYQEFGFQPNGNEFDEAGIAHLPMVLKLEKED